MSVEESQGPPNQEIAEQLQPTSHVAPGTSGRVFDANSEWGEKPGKITALRNPISEFNTRGGMDLPEYMAMVEHVETEHPRMGQEMWAEIKKRLPPFEVMQDPKTGQKLRVQRFNWPEDGDVSEQTVTFVNRGFYVSIDPDHIQYQHYSIAEELGTPLIVFENPEYGESDGLTHRQKEALRHQGDFEPVAESMLGIAKVLGVKQANLVGYSMAAAIADAIAAKASDKDFGIEIMTLLDMENPTVVAEGGLELAYDFASDGRNLKFTWLHPMDPVLRETARLEYSIPRGAMSYGRALEKDGQKTVLKKALDSQPNMRLVLASAGDSKIDPANANRRLYSELRAEFPERYMRRIVMPGEGHAYSNSAQRFAHLVKQVVAP